MSAAVWSRRFTLLVPLLVFVPLAALLVIGLTLNPREVSSPLTARPGG